ncbi:bola-like protein, partial [Gloeophyllum trabeum ATCC 11539]
PPSQAPALDEGERNIYNKLKEKFNPSELVVQDVSGGCGSFYAITIASDAFKGLPMVKQHRMVNDVLKKEFEGIHGLQV